MMEMASVTKSQGSCDMFARAKERGTAIKTVEQITSWLHTVHKVGIVICCSFVIYHLLDYCIEHLTNNSLFCP